MLPWRQSPRVSLWRERPWFLHLLMFEEPPLVYPANGRRGQHGGDVERSSRCGQPDYSVKQSRDQPASGYAVRCTCYVILTVVS